MTASVSSTDRAVERLCLAFSAELIAGGFLRGTYRSALDTLLALAINQANLAHMARNLTFQKTYAGLSHPPPDDLRRPVRVRSIAMSLGIPQETARRRVALMVEAGILTQTDAGVFMPKIIMETPVYATTAEATWRAIGDLYGAFRRLGALDAPDHAVVGGETPHRYMMRLWGDHFLRLVETLLPIVQEPFAIVLLFAILRESQATQTEAGKPVSASSLSRSLGLPFETVRRNALRLADAGLCHKTPRGYLITPELLDTPVWRQFAERHGQILKRFFSIMGERGLLGWWEADYQAANASPRSR
jgi:DNA-binding Lrp family transcriptional regulator